MEELYWTREDINFLVSPELSDVVAEKSAVFMRAVATVWKNFEWRMKIKKELSLNYTKISFWKEI